MARYALDHGNSALFISCAPSSGQHFLTYSGALSNDFRDSPQIRNLVADLGRVQSLAYGIDVPHQAVFRLGKKSSVSRVVMEHPTVSVAFDYILAGVKNEARLGLCVNYAHFETELSGVPHYANNTGVDLLSGLASRDQTQPTGDPFWPPPQREPKNLFLAVTKSGEEVEKPPFVWNTGDPSRKIDYSVREMDVVAFGNCYLQSYQARGAVGSPPTASVRFLAENINFHPSGSGCWIPALNQQDRKPISGRHFRIPSYYPDDPPSCLKPGDIVLDIVVTSGNQTGQNFDIRFEDGQMWINSFALGFELEREPLRSLGFIIPPDRPVNHPVFATCAFEAVVNENQTGTLLNLIDYDHDYNIVLQLRNPGCPNDLPAVPPYKTKAVAVRYDMVKAKLDAVSWSDGVGQRKRANFSFSAEMHPDDFSQGGFFISGLLNVSRLEDFLEYSHTGGAAFGDGEYLFTPSGYRITTAILPVVV